MNSLNRYEAIMAAIFGSHYREGMTEVFFEREDMVKVCAELGVEPPKNLGDVLYSFRYRTQLPEAIRSTAPANQEWVIRSVGQSRYKFSLAKRVHIRPSDSLLKTKVPDSTPGLIAMHALTDEQALLARIRYNRLLDIFSGVACYSLQNHLRTTVTDLGQVETDELYVGIDQRGAQYVFPVQAKGTSDSIGIIQIEQDFAMCKEKFASLICIPVAAQLLDSDLIALFALSLSEEGEIEVLNERQYRLVPPDQMSPGDMERYRKVTLVDLRT